MPARKPRFRLVAPRVPEAVLQKQMVDVLRVEIAPPGRISKDGVVFWGVDIANYGGTTPGLRTTRGLIAGIPDLFVLYRGNAYFIEVKAPDGILSDAQCTVAASILLAHAHFGVARSVEEVLELLDAWEIPRRHRLQIAG